MTTVRVSPRGAARWTRGHPWIYRSDTLDEPTEPGLVRVTDRRGRFLGQALYSPQSEIRLRLLELSSEAPVDAAWWRGRLSACARAREGIDATAWRVVHGEGDGLPSLVVDRYDRWLVVQLLSAGLETMRDAIVAALEEEFRPEGILFRHDASVRRHEGLPEAIEEGPGTVPDRVEVREGPVRYLAAPRTGQKTGAFLDQRTNRLLAGTLTRAGGRALDCFAYHGSFALHLAGRAAEVIALDVSEEALARGRENAALNGIANIDWQVANAFDRLADWSRSGARFDTIVVDPPAFAKSRRAVESALRGYHEINRRAIGLLAPGGVLITASCSFHVGRAAFEEMIQGAAADAGRPLRVLGRLGQSDDHPERITIPETAYLKGLALRAD